MSAEIQRLIRQPVKGTLKEVKKMIEDIKKAAIAVLGDCVALKEEVVMRRDAKELDLKPEDIPTTEHPLMPLKEEVDQSLSEAAVLRDMMRACLERLELLDPKAPELTDELVQKIAAK